MKCEDLVSGLAPLSISNIEHALDGSALLDKYSFQQLRTRLVYEKKKGK